MLLSDRDPAVAVVIPVKNGAPEVRSCIEGILRQSVKPREIIAIDSGSTDETLDILAEYPDVSVVGIPSSEFDHGETRNYGVSLTTSAFVAFTVQDARAVGTDWIAQLLEGFTDELVAGVCGSQIVPHDRDKNPVAWFRPWSEPGMVRFHFPDPAEFERLLPGEKRRICGWDNVTAMYRREALLKIPFRRTAFAEDLLWACDAIESGCALVYNSGARVYHYHAESPRYAYRRSIAALYHAYRAVGYIPEEPQMLLPILRAANQLIRENAITWRERAYWAGTTLGSRVAIRAAVRAFRAATSNGREAVDALYQRHCSLPPVARKLRR